MARSSKKVEQSLGLLVGRGVKKQIQKRTIVKGIIIGSRS
jgi:hypothetical protein